MVNPINTVSSFLLKSTFTGLLGSILVRARGSCTESIVLQWLQVRSLACNTLLHVLHISLYPKSYLYTLNKGL